MAIIAKIKYTFVRHKQKIRGDFSNIVDFDSIIINVFFLVFIAKRPNISLHIYTKVLNLELTNRKVKKKKTFTVITQDENIQVIGKDCKEYFSANSLHRPSSLKCWAIRGAFTYLTALRCFIYLRKLEEGQPFINNS